MQVNNPSRIRSNSKKKETITLSWPEYITLVNELASKIYDSQQNFNCIYGVPRGGLIPATMISYKIGVPIINTPLDAYDQSILIVDDIIDTGKTIIELTSFLKHHASSSTFKIASIYHQAECNVIPDYYIVDNDSWIEFPYEEGENDGLEKTKQNHRQPQIHV